MGLQRMVMMLVALLAIAGCNRSTAAPVTHDPFGPPHVRGVAYHGMWSMRDAADRGRILDTIKASGVPWVRMDVAWNTLQPNGPGSYDEAAIADIDQRLAEVSDRGLKTLVMFWWAPPWSSGTTVQSGVPANAQDYASAAAWLVQRWPTQIAAMQVWNEPNLPEFYDNPDPASYARLLAATYPRVKAVRPDLTVVAAAPSGLDLRWYEGLLNAPVQGTFDVLGAHPYPRVGDMSPQECARIADSGCDMDAFISFLDDQGLSEMPVWVTEFGWSTHGDFPGMQLWQRGVTEEEQASYTAGMLAWFSELPQVQAAFVYRDEDFVNSDPHRNGFGILRADGSPKPVYEVLTCATASACGDVAAGR